MFLLLSEADIVRVLPMNDLLETMQRSLVEFSSKRVQQPLRTVIEVGDQKSFLGVMPAYIAGSGALGTKLVTVFGSNAAVGLPSHLATIVLLDSSTGALLAVMDGRYITEARTAAVSAVATKLLARPEAGTLGLIGTGVQARSHLEALGYVRPLREVRVWSPNGAHRERFVREMQPRTRARLLAAASAREAVDDAELVVLASAACEPVLFSDWISDGTHICAVGACRPDQREMDTALVRRARVFVDSRSGALSEAGDIVIPMKEGAFDEAHIAGEIGDLAAGRLRGREGDRQVTLFKSLGMAVEDVAAAHLAYTRARERGVGKLIEI
jgi:ornithine cyclodeaminase